MKLPSYLTKSRHGVYYYRIQFTTDKKRREQRITLSTKCPKVAKAKAIQISAIIFGNTFSIPDIAMAFDPKNPLDVLELLKKNRKNQQFDIELPDGRAIRNIKPDEVNSALVAYNHMASTSIESIGTIPQHVFNQTSPTSSPQVQGGATLNEMIQKFATRQDEKLAQKTLYDYRKSQEAFSTWIEKRKNNKAYPIRLITEADISDFIDDLKAQKRSDRTIQHKYLAALSGLFELAQKSNSYPKGNNPTKGHKVFTKKDLKKRKDTNGYQPFKDSDLDKIFMPENLLALPKPADFWLPLLGLYTGGRIEELCQLAITDIKKVEGIWAISINDEEYKSLKSTAARREIPIHPQLIKLGFLDYVEDAKEHGDMLFPYLNADAFGKFSNTPGERFGDYLDSIGITDKQLVFHSFRKTSNNTLKQAGATLEERSEYVGHEVESTNWQDYSKQFSVAYLATNVASKLVFNMIDCGRLTYKKGRFSEILKSECARKYRLERKKQITALRDKGDAKKTNAT